MDGQTLVDEKSLDKVIEHRKDTLTKIKLGLAERLNLSQKLENLDDDTPLFGSGLKLDSVDATEIIVLLDETFAIRVNEGEDPSYMRSINTLTTFVINRLANPLSENQINEQNEQSLALLTSSMQANQG